MRGSEEMGYSEVPEAEIPGPLHMGRRTPSGAGDRPAPRWPLILPQLRHIMPSA